MPRHFFLSHTCICIRVYVPGACGRALTLRACSQRPSESPETRSQTPGRLIPISVVIWPLHNIAIANLVWCMAYTKGSVGGRIFPNSRAIVLQQCGQCRRAGRMQERLIRAQTTKSKTISCKGQLAIILRMFRTHRVVITL